MQARPHQVPSEATTQATSRIVTLTMNPALDKSTSTHHVTPEDKLRCRTLRLDPGGGGLNVARAIHKLGGTSLPLYVAGGMNGQVLQNLLQAEHLPEWRLTIDGETRESFTVVEETTTRQYRFNLPGPTLAHREWQGVLDLVTELIPRPDYLVASGSLPPGVPENFYVQLAERVAGWPTRLIVDTSGLPLQALVDECAPVYMIKPNHGELAALVGRELEDDDDILTAARELLARCAIEILIVSLGAGGVLFITEAQAISVRAPTVPIRSKIGAGDSTVAGITLGLTRGLPLLEAIRFGVAAGSAAVMTPGTDLCSRQDTERLFAQMQREALLVR
ncbi:MAG: 1-phosphofructokinase family hexose kinase [Caldilineaceae bacterium]|nr:1-phosphofructokinase family hexose kinase [Caldilineaceae bacterium]